MPDSTTTAETTDERPAGDARSIEDTTFHDPWLRDPAPQAHPAEAAPVYEFFGPFAHVEGRYEWCRIRSPTHGAFDTFIVLGESRAVPAHVYVNDDRGRRFMEERYPECAVTSLDSEDGLEIQESDGGRIVRCRLVSEEGPVRAAEMRFEGNADANPRQVPYGGTGAPVWGSERFTCWGVDLVLDAQVHGTLQGPGLDERYEGDRALLTLGSFGRIGRRQ